MSLAPLNPIQMLPARDRVAAALREAILSHQFAEGEELTLKDTAAQLACRLRRSARHSRCWRGRG